MKTNIEKLLNSGSTKEMVKAMLMVNDGMSASNATKALKPYAGNKKTNDMPAIVAHIKGIYGTMSRRDVAKSCAEHGLCKESTAFHYLSLMPFVEEWMRQS